MTERGAGSNTSDRRQSLGRVAGNSGWNLAAFMVGIVANLVTLPFVIKRLGIFQFGICGLLIALAAPLTLVGTTLGQSAAQGIARYRAQSDPAAVKLFCSAIIAVASGAIAIGALLLTVLAPLIVQRLYPNDEAALNSIWVVSGTLAFGWIAQQLSLLMQGVHVACQSYRRIALVNGLGAVGSLLSIFGVVGVEPDVGGYILALALGYALTSTIWGASIFFEFSWCLVRPRADRNMTRSIAAFTSWQMLAQLVAVLAGQMDRYLLGAWVNASAVGYYNVSQRVEEVAYIGVLRAGDALFPQFSVNASSTVQRRSEIFFRASWMLNLLAAVILGPLLPLAPSLLLVWIGPASSNNSTLVLQVLTVGGLLGCAGNVFSLYALGIAKTRYIALLSVATAVTTTLASVVLLRRLGFIAAGLGGVLGMVVNLMLMISLTRRHFRGHARAKSILAAMILPIGTALSVGGGLAVMGIPTQNSWFKLVAAYAVISTTILLAVVLTSALTREGRSSLTDLRRLLALPISWLAALAKSRSAS